MSRVIQTEPARRDVLESWHYIAADSVPAADRWMETVISRFEVLAENPMIGRPREEFGEKLRSYLVGKHIIFYRPVTDGVEIVRVVHGARDLDSVFDSPDAP